MERPIGVIDSGIGGLTVLRQIVEDLPNEEYIYIADSKNAPYGPKSKEEIKHLVFRLADYLLQHNVKMIVVACNTATAGAIYDLRKKYSIPIVGLEPAIKPAALNTKTKNIGVLATEGTFRGNHFINTSNKYKDYVKIHMQVAKGLVELAEAGIFDGKQVDDLIEKYVKPLVELNIDYLVLGCTHYPLFYDSIKKFTGDNIKIIDSAKPVAIRVKDLLMTNHILSPEIFKTKIQFISTKEVDNLMLSVKKIFNIEQISCVVEKVEI